jgi:hypothetical protein
MQPRLIRLNIEPDPRTVRFARCSKFKGMGKTAMAAP